MTFAQIVARVQSRLNLNSSESTTNIGNWVNDRYRSVTSAIGVALTRRSTVMGTATIGVTTMAFANTEKLINVQDRLTTPYRILDEWTIEEIRAEQVSGLTTPTAYAIVGHTADTVTIEMNAVPQTAINLYADCLLAATDLSGSNEPAVPESFHDVLEYGALADAYDKMGKISQSAKWEKKYEDRLSDLRYFLAKSSYANIVQGKTRGTLGAGSSGSSGGSGSINGALSWTQTGLITFDRDPLAPFAVSSGSAVVPNLDADLLDGLNSTAFRLVSVAINESDFTFTDVTTANVTSTKHGLAPKSPANVTRFLDGGATPAWRQVEDSDLATSDVTNNNFTTAKHGFAPKGTTDTAKFLRGDGTFEVAVDNSVVDGRLTLTTALPVTTADVTGATNVFFTPYRGNRIALFDGTNWKIYTFTERTLALGTITNDLPYDVFIFDNAGTITLEAVAWTSKTARVTALVLQDGVWLKTGSLTKRYLGTFHTTSTTTTEDSFAKRLLWNYYNRVGRAMRVKDTTDTWTYTTATFRQANANTANQLAVVVGVAEVEASFETWANFSNTNVSVAGISAVGEDVTNAKHTNCMTTISQSAVAAQIAPVGSKLSTMPAIGYHFYAQLELSAATGTTTWYGDNSGAIQQSGMTGRIEG